MSLTTASPNTKLNAKDDAKIAKVVVMKKEFNSELALLGSRAVGICSTAVHTVK